MADNRKKGRGLTVERQKVVVSLALLEQHINYTEKSTVNLIKLRTETTFDYGTGSWNSFPIGLGEVSAPSGKSDLTTVYYRLNTIKLEKGIK